MFRYLPSAVCLFLAGCAGFQGYSYFREVDRAPDISFVGPGTITFAAPVATVFTMWQVSPGQSKTGLVGHEPGPLPPGTTITIKRPDGSAIASTPYPNTKVSSPRGMRRSVLEFTASGVETYQIAIEGLPESRTFEITHGSFLKPVLLLMAAGGVTFLLVILSVVLAILAATGLFPKRTKSPI